MADNINTNNSEDSAISGGLLVVLGIVVAAGLGFLYYNGTIGHRNDTTNVVNIPAPESAQPAAGGSASNDNNAAGASTTTEKSTTSTTTTTGQ